MRLLRLFDLLLLNSLLRLNAWLPTILFLEFSSPCQDLHFPIVMIHFHWEASSEEYCCALHVREETPSTKQKGDRGSEVEGRKRIVLSGTLSLGSLAINRANSHEGLWRGGGGGEGRVETFPYPLTPLLRTFCGSAKKSVFPISRIPHFSR